MGVVFVFKLGDFVDKNKANSLSPIVLAFIGDAVYSLFVREKRALETDFKTGELSKRAIDTVNAIAQADFAREIIPILTEEELAVFKRARNAKKTSKAKSASVADYHLSTGLEALLGYLYLTGQIDRLNFILYRGKNIED